MNDKTLAAIVRRIADKIEADAEKNGKYCFRPIKHFILNSFSKEIGSEMKKYSSEVSKIFRARAGEKPGKARSQKAKKRKEELRCLIDDAKQFEMEELIRSGEIVPPIDYKELLKLDEKIRAGEIPF
ncbi:MAG: hypothetical protein NTZ97_03120 [Candidatus Moranbacteria bacterium]|nr:hypothetical protein [Candidatus Moranbacteria bacterium]